MKNNTPKISIVTVVYNGEKFIEETIKSVLEQDYSALEYIVIDGNSKDKTVSIINRYKDQIQTIVSEADRGVYDAMNKAILLATGEWILFMNAGDRFFSKTSLSDFFSSTYALNDYDVIYGDAEFRLKKIAYVVVANDQVNTNEYMPFSHQAAFTRTSIAKKYMFDLSYKIAADTAFFLRLVRSNCKFLHIPVTVCSYDALDGLSVNNEIRRCEEIVSLQVKWNHVDANSPYFKKYVRDAKIRQWIRKLTPRCVWIYLREKSIRNKHIKVYGIGEN